MESFEESVFCYVLLGSIKSATNPLKMSQKKSGLTPIKLEALQFRYCIGHTLVSFIEPLTVRFRT